MTFGIVWQSCNRGAWPTPYQPTETLELTRLAQKVRMLINKDDINYQELSNSMNLLTKSEDAKARQAYVQAMTPLSQKILKAEWEVLKRDLNYKPSTGGGISMAEQA